RLTPPSFSYPTSRYGRPGRLSWRRSTPWRTFARGLLPPPATQCTVPGSVLVAQNTQEKTNMYYIDPHIHMISRVTDDYHRMALSGCVAISEPAFWAGFDRGSADGFRDYFRHLTEVKSKRAAQFGIKHFSWLCINAKEAENVSLSRDVIALIP